LNSKSPRIQAFDGIRGLSVLAVFIFHTLPITDTPQRTWINVWNLVAKSSWVGVDFFFVLSGFLITGTLLNAKHRPNYFRNFYLRRALRILPLYYFSIAMAIFVIPRLVPNLLPAMFQRVIQNQAWLWTFTHNFLQAHSQHLLPGFGHFWSLAVEEQFYLLWPALVIAFSTRRLLWLTGFVALAEPFIRFAAITGGCTPWAIRHLTYFRFDSLLLGAAACLVFRHSRYFHLPKLALPVLALAAACVLASLVAATGYLPYDSPLTSIYGYSAVAALCACLLLSAADHRTSAARIFNVSWLRWFGKYSYGIYIFSVPAILLFDTLLGQKIAAQGHYLFLPLARFLCAGLASVAAALVSWHWLEAPALRLKSHFQPLPQPAQLALF